MDIVKLTNQDKPFEKGERIEYCDDHFIVEANYGRTGRVSIPASQTDDTPTRMIDPFYWTFQDVACTRVITEKA